MDGQEKNDRATLPRPAELESLVGGLMRAVERGMAKQVASNGLLPLDVRVLRMCFERDGECTATELAEVLPVDPARISRTVKRIVDKGLLVRRRLPTDRRVVMLSLSEEGYDLTTQIISRLEAYNADLIEGISAEDMRVFKSVADRIAANHAAM